MQFRAAAVIAGEPVVVGYMVVVGYTVIVVVVDGYFESADIVDVIVVVVVVVVDVVSFQEWARRPDAPGMPKKMPKKEQMSCGEDQHHQQTERWKAAGLNSVSEATRLQTASDFDSDYSRKWKC